MRMFFLLVFVGAGLVITYMFFRQPGTVDIEWNGYAISSTPGMLALAVALLVLVLLVLQKIVSMVLMTPARLRRQLDARRDRRQKIALARSMTDFSLGRFDRLEAMLRRHKLLDESIGLMLAAASSHAAGHTKHAEHYYAQLCNDRDSEAFGWHGRLRLACERHDTKQAQHTLATMLSTARGRALAKGVLLADVFRAQHLAGRHEDAIASAERLKRLGLETEELRQLHASSLTALSAGAEPEARCLYLEQAARLDMSAHFIPYIRALLEADHTRQARKALQKMSAQFLSSAPGHNEAQNLGGLIARAWEAESPESKLRALEKNFDNGDKTLNWRAYDLLASTTLEAGMLSHARHWLERWTDNAPQSAQRRSELETRIRQEAQREPPETPSENPNVPENLKIADSA